MIFAREICSPYNKFYSENQVQSALVQTTRITIIVGKQSVIVIPSNVSVERLAANTRPRHLFLSKQILF